MDAHQSILTKLDVREFSSKDVAADIKLKILEAGRATGSGMNTQHWRFILVQDAQNLKKLAQDSTTGKWVERCNFAIIVLTNPKFGFHLLDAGRAAQDMQLAAWNFGVVSGIFTGVKEENLRRDFGIPTELTPSVVIGFGYAAKKIVGRKSRLPLNEIAFINKYGNSLDPEKL